MIKRDISILVEVMDDIWKKNYTPSHLATRLKASDISYYDVAAALMTSPQNVCNYCNSAVKRGNVTGNTEIYLFLVGLAEKGLI